MPSSTLLNTLGYAFLLLAGLGLQCFALLRPHKRGPLCLCAGAVLVTGFALYDRDVTLLLGQWLALPLLWLRARERS